MECFGPFTFSQMKEKYYISLSKNFSAMLYFALLIKIIDGFYTQCLIFSYLNEKHENK